MRHLVLLLAVLMVACSDQTDRQQREDEALQRERRNWEEFKRNGKATRGAMRGNPSAAMRNFRLEYSDKPLKKR